ncbi:hypothetical protein [Candidatus Avelusimicrobium caledoniensis]|uniref:hypothetical protein n=1 Tax=Candidatus Avelusimicrobium caledoniensis TaxID=3416220 RepID=UPI003D1515B4
MEKERCFKAVVNQIKMLFGATHHSSSRSVSMRDIVVGFFNAPLYPGLQISGMTNGARITNFRDDERGERFYAH